MALKGKFEYSHWMVKCIQWIGCVILFTTPAMISIVAFPQPLSVGSLKWIQFLQTASMLLLPPLCMAYLWSKQPLQWLKLTGESFKDSKDLMAKSVAAIGIMLVALPAINLLSHLNQQMTLPAFLEPMETWMKTQEENAAQMTELFMRVTTFDGLIINLLLMALLPAIAEELTFRGVLQRLLQGKDHNTNIPHIAIWSSAIIFSAIHMQFYGFVPRMLMGALFGYMLVWTGSIWMPMLMHFTNNAMAVLLYFVAYRAGWNMEQVDAIGTNDTLWLGIVSMVVTIVGIYAFRRSITMSNASSRMSSGN